MIPGSRRSDGEGIDYPLQRIFPTQELNWGLLHCKQVLYQLSYQGSPLINLTAAAAKSLQSCLTLCNPVDCSLPRSSVHGIFQARILGGNAQYWKEMPFPSPVDLSNPGMEPRSPAYQAYLTMHIALDLCPS